MQKNYTIQAEDDHLATIQFLEDRLYEYNSTKLNTGDGRLFSGIVRGENNEIIAGIAGWTWAGICEITQLWVDGPARSTGVGKMLLEAAEEEAYGRGCRTILVRTFSFQAPEFYRKYGFGTIQVLDDFPPGHHYYILTKRLPDLLPQPLYSARPAEDSPHS